MQFFKTKQQKHDEAFMKVNPFGKVSDDCKGKSIKEISDLLSTHGIDSPDHFRLVHELNRRVENVQARAIYIGIVAGLVGVVVGVLLTAWLQSLQVYNHMCKCSSENNSQRPITQPKQPELIPQMPLDKPSGIKPNTDKSQGHN